MLKICAKCAETEALQVDVNVYALGVMAGMLKFSLATAYGLEGIQIGCETSNTQHSVGRGRLDAVGNTTKKLS
ncbi:hypothetical protein Y032_0199g1662 [Ancylostoma ceylanicum]|uniref:Uncharacterized protein n=1 Tax=Ancylostoma ceylanicum TaxID=53326 RepID=A0A016SMT9_9BILA|nr:hypothetical protein Y032_0199g1662 [Ancylostoma ceylanicum]